MINEPDLRAKYVVSALLFSPVIIDSLFYTTDTFVFQKATNRNNRKVTNMDFRFSQKIWLCFLESTKQLRNSSDLLLKRDFFSSETDVIRGRVGENNENFIVAKFVKSGINSYMSPLQQKKIFANSTLIRQVRRHQLV